MKPIGRDMHWFAAIACALAGCQAVAPSRRMQETLPEKWPQQLADRTRQVVTDEYVLYANDAGAATELHHWLNEEVAEFRSRYAEDIEGTGIVFAVEPGKEPVVKVEQWYKQNVHRSRRIRWTSSIRSQVFSSPHGRPYCLDNRPYFTESFALRPEEAVGSGVIDLRGSTPAWICFLTTDEHVTRAFDVALRNLKQSHNQWVNEEVPAVVRVLSWPATVMFSAASELLIYPRWRRIDVELMRLQRRETLWQALIDCTPDDDSDCTAETATLRDEIDRTWKDIWVRRPFD